MVSFSPLHLRFLTLPEKSPGSSTTKVFCGPMCSGRMDFLAKEGERAFYIFHADCVEKQFAKIIKSRAEYLILGNFLPRDVIGKQNLLQFLGGCPCVMDVKSRWFILESI